MMKRDVFSVFLAQIFTGLTRIFVKLGLLMIVGLLIFPMSRADAHAESSSHSDSDKDFSGWTFALGAGGFFLEQDEELESGGIYELKIGYDYNTRWSTELSLGYLPFLNNNKFDPPADSPENMRFFLTDDTYAVRGAFDVLYHLNGDADRVWDPYLAATGGVIYYDANLENDQHFDPFGGLGFGLGYQISGPWEVRGDYRYFVAGHDTESNHQGIFSVAYRSARSGRQRKDAPLRLAPSDIETDTKGPGLLTIYFPFDSAILTQTAKEKLRSNAAWLRKNPDTTVALAGHCDERGTNEYNLALGQRRAVSAQRFLRSLGVAKSRLKVVSYGEEQPADPGSGEAAWARNRRVECIPQ